MRSFKGLLAALFFFVAACLLNAAVPGQIPQIVWHVLKIELGDSQTRLFWLGQGSKLSGPLRTADSRCWQP